MKIKVQSIHFTADKKLLKFVEEKVDKLFQFYDNIIDSEVYLRLDKSENTENKIAEIKIPVKPYLQRNNVKLLKKQLTLLLKHYESKSQNKKKNSGGYSP
jgi:hypothetical protein